MVGKAEENLLPVSAQTHCRFSVMPSVLVPTEVREVDRYED